uniref:NADH dehydrogenase subunit 4L n=1 Tax=Oospira (Acrophaedusa) sp. RM-2016 TaxID=1885895 RepID=A0A224ABR2_9EUPU|nr:NADH dehydrogenase subunit 4L [Oospira (Acrophaedusa) sp. RM-2016]
MLWIPQYLSVLMMFLVLLYFSMKNHYLPVIIILEVISLFALMISITMCFLVMESPNCFFLILTLLVCEAAMGLSILLSVMKINGNDKISSLLSW